MPDEAPETASAPQPSHSSVPSTVHGNTGYIFDVDDQPTNIVVENGQIKLASMFSEFGDARSFTHKALYVKHNDALFYTVYINYSQWRDHHKPSTYETAKQHKTVENAHHTRKHNIPQSIHIALSIHQQALPITIPNYSAHKQKQNKGNQIRTRKKQAPKILQFLYIFYCLFYIYTPLLFHSFNLVCLFVYNQIHTHKINVDQQNSIKCSKHYLSWKIG